MQIKYQNQSIILTEKFDFTSTIKNQYERAVSRGKSDKPFYICDIGDVVKKHELWCSKFPRIEPFYAMKCNPDSLIVSSLATLNVGFDCASKMEISQALSYGVPADRIVYANPCKPVSHISYAYQTGVRMMTFDSEMELQKVALYHPEALMILRIFVGATKALCPLGLKFGAEINDVHHLLELAISLNVKVIGISFHVGSGCFDSSAYQNAILAARNAFDFALELGHEMYLLDIGGGFPGNIQTESETDFFNSVCDTINSSLESYFSDTSVRVIAEPGRYFVSSAYQLACSVTSIRSTSAVIPSDRKYSYFLNDGVYGSFNCTVFDHYIGQHYLLSDVVSPPLTDSVEYESTFWGPTCDSFDKILSGFKVRELKVGECVAFKNMGAYTMAAGCTFNGFPRPHIFYYCNPDAWKYITGDVYVDVDNPAHIILEEEDLEVAPSNAPA